MNFTVYNSVTGRIIRTGSGGTLETVNAQAYNPNEVVLTEPCDLGNDYVLAGVITPRQSLNATWNKTTITADGIDEAVLSTLPNCTVTVDGTDYVVTDGSFEFSATSIGEYAIRVDEVEYIAEKWMIIAE